MQHTSPARLIHNTVLFPPRPRQSEAKRRGSKNMDPQLLFRPMATVEADLAARRASQSAPTDPLNPSAPSTAAPSSGVLSSNITGSAEPGLPAVGSSGLGLASGAAPPAGAAGLAGGLGSSPNVPTPGTSINPATGLPHTAGLTRQELAAMKAEQEHGRRMSEMSGRQQAAAQLVGSGPVLGGAGQPGSPTGGEKSVIDVRSSSLRVSYALAPGSLASEYDWMRLT